VRTLARDGRIPRPLRALAAGETQIGVAKVTGLSPSRIRQIAKGD
jgi:hypothetical protein